MANEVNSILAALETQLEGVDGTGSYTIKFRSVDRYARSAAEVSDRLRPWCGIAYTDTVVENELHKRLRCTMKVSLIAIAGVQRSEDRGVVADELTDNILTAIYSDVHLDDNATLCRVAGFRTDEADELGKDDVCVVVDLEIIYHKDLSA